jgi:hypothetical protein
MTVVFADINGRLEHQDRERDAGDPCVEAESHEQTKYEEDNAGRPVMLVEVEDGGPEGEADVQDACDPDECLGEDTGEPYVGIAQDNGNDQNEYEENDCVRIEGEVVLIVIDAAAGSVAIGCVTLESDAGDDGVAGEEENQLRAVWLALAIACEGGDVYIPECQPTSRCIWACPL